MIPRWLPASADDVEVTASDGLAVVSACSCLSAQDIEAAHDAEDIVQDL
jgi:histidine ammonia-lyase